MAISSLYEFLYIFVLLRKRYVTWIIIGTIILLKFLLLLLNCQIYNRLPRGAVGGYQANVGAFSAEEEAKAKVVDFELDKNREYPNIDDVEGFRI